MKKNTNGFVKKDDDDRNFATLTLQNKIKQPRRKIEMFPVNSKENRRNVYQLGGC